MNEYENTMTPTGAAGTVMGETFSILLERYTAALEGKIRYRDEAGAMHIAFTNATERFRSFEEERLLSPARVIKILNEELGKVR